MHVFTVSTAKINLERHAKFCIWFLMYLCTHLWHFPYILWHQNVCPFQKALAIIIEFNVPPSFRFVCVCVCICGYRKNTHIYFWCVNENHWHLEVIWKITILWCVIAPVIGNIFPSFLLCPLFEKCVCV